MKKILILIIFFIILPYLFDVFYPNSTVLQRSLTFTNKSPETIPQTQVTFKDQKYFYSFFSPKSSQLLIFNLNLMEKQPSLDILDEQKCQYLINGGFYDKQDQPIGLVIKDGLEISPAQKNSLFNGFLSATNSASFTISTNKPSLKSIVAIQTGPILIKDSIPQKLQLITDQHKRRMILAIREDNTPYFISISFKDSEQEGPLLGDLPELISAIGKNENVDFVDAINLDGGSASTFYSPEIHLKELTTIGSYLCFK